MDRPRLVTRSPRHAARDEAIAPRELPPPGEERPFGVDAVEDVVSRPGPELVVAAARAGEPAFALRMAESRRLSNLRLFAAGVAAAVPPLA